MLIDTSFFVGELSLPQVGAGSSSKINNNDEFDLFRDEYEVDIIDSGLGKLLSNELFRNINSTTGKLRADADVKWDKLINGDEYTIRGTKYFWRGLVERRGSISRSLIAYYVYYRYMTDNIIHKSTLGMVRGQAENSVAASTIPTLTRAWRKLYEWYGDCNYDSDFNFGSHYKHRGVFVSDYFREDNSKNVSMYQYLKDHKDSFPDWYFTPIENKNQFQI